MKLTGKITDKSSKDGETNGKSWKRFMFKIGGKSFSSFNANFDEFKVNDFVDIDYEISGSYNNLTNMVMSVIPKEEFVESSEVIKTTTPLRSLRDEERIDTTASIVSQVIIKAVADLVCAGKVETGHIQISCLQLAENYKETKKKLLE